MLRRGSLRRNTVGYPLPWIAYFTHRLVPSICAEGYCCADLFCWIVKKNFLLLCDNVNYLLTIVCCSSISELFANYYLPQRDNFKGMLTLKSIRFSSFMLFTAMYRNSSQAFLLRFRILQQVTHKFRNITSTL